MPYSKTVWANGTTPAINATNLNKIEQGIYDNSVAALTEVYVVDPTETDQGATGNGKSVKAYVDAIGTTKKAILLFLNSSGSDTTTYTFSTSETITSNITCRINPGAIFSIDSGVTVTVNGWFDCGPWQAFSGAGSVILGPNACVEIYAEWWGAVGDGATDDSAAIQAAIDMAAASKRGTIRLLNKNYKCNLVLKSFVSLLGSKGIGGSGYTGAQANNRTMLTAYATGYVIDTPSTESYQASAEGINLVGLGSGTPCVGLRLRDHLRGTFRDLSFDNFADQAVLAGTDGGKGAANEFTRIFAQNCILNTARSAKIGVIEVHEDCDDNFFNYCEISGLDTFVSSNLYLCSWLIQSANNFINGCIGEQSEVGFRIDTDGWNRFVNCRADLNQAHGWEIACGENSFSSCIAMRNSKHGTNTYDGFRCYSPNGTRNVFSACLASSLDLDGWYHRYGFWEDINASTIGQNVYSACKSRLHATAWFYGHQYGGSGPSAPLKGIILFTDLDTTPSVGEGDFFGANYTGNATITNFDDPTPGQIINLLQTGGAGTVTIQHGTNIMTNTGANKDLSLNKIYTFRFFNGVWYEVA